MKQRYPTFEQFKVLVSLSRGYAKGMVLTAALPDARWASSRRLAILVRPSPWHSAQHPHKRRRLDRPSGNQCSCCAARSQVSSRNFYFCKPGLGLLISLLISPIVPTTLAQVSPDNDAVKAALREADKAAKEAQQALQHVHKLPSARLKQEVRCKTQPLCCCCARKSG